MVAYQPVVQACGSQWRQDLNIWNNEKCFDATDARYKHEDYMTFYLIAKHVAI
jgi:hypothetical protein